MNRVFLFSFLIVFNLSKSALAQEFQWAKRIGGVYYDGVNSMKVGGSGNVYMYGYFSGSVDFGSGIMMTGIETGDFFISKHSPGGKVIWVRQIRDPKAKGFLGDMEIDGNENIFFTGSFSDTLDFDPGNGTQKFVASGSMDGFVTKLDSAGNWIWTKLIGQKGTKVEMHNISVDPLGNPIIDINIMGKLVIKGMAQTDTLEDLNYNKSILIKINTEGSLLWTKSIVSKSFTAIKRIKTDKTGNIYFCGNFLDTTDFNPGPEKNSMVCTENVNIFICKLNSNGDYVWSKQLEGKGYANAFAIDIDKNDHVVIAGTFKDSIDFNPGTDLVMNFGLLGDVFICKLDESGNYLWSKSFGSFAGDDIATDIRFDSNGWIYITGKFWYYCDFDPGPQTFFLSGNTYRYSLFLGCYNINGDLRWVQKLLGDPTKPTKTNPIGLEPVNIGVDNLGGVYLAGNFGSYTDINPGKEIQNITSKGESDIFLLSLSDRNTGDVKNIAEKKLLLVPNPTNGLLTLYGRNIERIEVLNGQGIPIDGYSVQINNSANEATVDLSEKPDGVYFLNIRSDASNGFLKLLKQQ